MAKKISPRSTKKKATVKPIVKKTAPKKTVKKAAPKKAAVKKPVAKKAAPQKKTAAKKKTPARAVAPKTAPQKKPNLKKPVKKAPATKTAGAIKAPSKKTPARKKPAATKAAPKKSVKTTPSQKTPAQKKSAVKVTTTKKKAVKKTAAPEAVTPEAAPAKAPAKKALAKAGLKSRLLSKTGSKKTASAGFSLDDVKEIAKKTAATEKDVAKNNAAKAKDKAAALEATIKAVKPAKVAAASLADILGFNPAGGQKVTYNDPKLVPAKFRKYYKLLLELRTHLTGQIDQHAEDTLKRSAKEDAGDLSSYGQHMADAGTDTFDRDFALSMVSSEQEALAEIDAAIQRVKNGTYGNDEITGEPIDKDRLMVVPFTRYTAQTQKNLERNRHRVRTQAGLGGDMGDNAGAMTDPNADE